MRYRKIDLQKGILTVLMILAHCIQYFSLEQYAAMNIISDYVNLTTFSGFVFTFGFVSYHAYLKNKTYSSAYRKIIRNVLRLTIAYYISAFANYVFFYKKSLDLSSIKNIILLRPMIGYSEFLLSFACMMFLLLVFFRLFQRADLLLLVGSVVVSVVSCIISPLPVQNSWLSLFIGCNNISYPVFSYLVYFVLGIYIAKNGIKKHWIVGGIAASAFVVYFIATLFNEPRRWPPSVIFLLGAALFIYIYFVVSTKMMTIKWLKIPNYILCSVGENSLFYLLGSNLCLFTLHAIDVVPSEWYAILLVYLAIMGLLWYLSHINKITNKTELLKK